MLHKELHASLKLTVFLKETGGNFLEGPLDIGSEAFRWLVRDLDRVLQYCYREVFGWHGAQEQPEILVYIFWLLRQLLDNLLH